MPGFNAFIGEGAARHSQTQEYSKVLTGEGYYIENTSLDKFSNDKVFFENDQYLVVLEGVVFNKATFNEPNGSWADCLIGLYEKNGESFFNEFRGSFCGLLFDKRKDLWIIFTDHVGSRQVFYQELDGALHLSTDISSIYRYSKSNGVSHELDTEAAYMILSYGFTLEQKTLSARVSKLLPGHYLRLEQGQMTRQFYFGLTNEEDHTLSDEDAIERIDQVFKQALDRQFSKDREYGLRHFVALSGGLDSRMVSWIAHEMGYEDQLNFSFSQSDYFDEFIPKQIATRLKHEWIFKALDNGTFLNSYEEITELTGGNGLYFGLAHGNSLYKLLNYESLGMCHSGQLGEWIFGSILDRKDNDVQFKLGDGAYSKRFVSKLQGHQFQRDYGNMELYNFYVRGFSGTNNGLLSIQSFTETCSPFYDVDVMDFALSMPVKMRSGHGIYKKWVLAKYPEAAEYTWEKVKSKITSKPITFRGKRVYWGQVTDLIGRRLTGKAKYGLDTKNHMNPFDYWLRTNKELSEELNRFKDESSELIKDPELRKDINELYNSGNAMEKLQAISLLSANKTFFS